jgi:ribonucleotide reductase alpha subunit
MKKIISKIVKIEKKGKGKVYDFTVEDIHRILANNFYTSNCSINHPDSEHFIDAKIDRKKVTGANVSVKVDDEFMKSVEDGAEYEQKFPIYSDNPRFQKSIKAKDLWDKIIHNAWESAEPGVLFWDTIIRESVADSYADLGFRTISTNPSLRWNTKVLTKDGIFNVKDLSDRNDGYVIVRNLKGEWKEGKTFKSGINKQLYKIIFTNNAYEVYCTGDHKWPLVNTNGNIINPQNGNIIKKKTEDLNRLDKIYFPQFKEVLDVNKDLTRNDGFVCGWNLGDGWISYHKIHESNVYGFLFSKEDYDFGIHNTVLEYINNINEKDCHLRENKGCYEFSSSSKNVDSKFKEFGLTSKKDGLPSIVWESNDDFVKGLVDGLFSSDGSVDEKNRIITYTTCHKKLAEDIHKLLSFYGIKSYLLNGSNKNPFDDNKISYRYDIKINNKSIIKFNKFFKLSNKNKQNKIDNIIKINEYGKYSKNSEILSNRDYLVVKDVIATDIYEDVYDITVYDDTHTFQTEVGITSNCGEITLCTYDSCRLTAMNLYSFVEEPFMNKSSFNWDKFKEYVRYAQRFMDDIIDLEIEKIDIILEKIKSDPEDEKTKMTEIDLWEKIKDKSIRGRRTGLGVTAEGDMLAALGLTYGTKEATDFSIKVHKTLAIEAYKSSVIMAKERGAFPIYDYERENSSEFIKRIRKADKELDDMLKEYGRRNISLLTIAPTGSVSILTRTTSGIEPVFLPAYKRRRKINPNDKDAKTHFIDDTGDHWEEYTIMHPMFAYWLKLNDYDVEEFKKLSQEEMNEIIQKSPYHKSSSNDVDWHEKVLMQGEVQKWVDHSISVTINLPNEVTEETVDELYKTAWKAGCKGLTVYRDGSRDGVLIKNDDSKKTIEDYLKENNAPRRPKTLECDVVRFVNNKEKWIGFLGMYEEKDGEKYPYELFTGLMESFPVPSYVERGYIKKNKDKKTDKNQYDFVYIDKDGYEVIMGGLNRAFNREFWNTSKMLSAMLRHKIHLPTVINLVDSLKINGGGKDGFPMFGTWQAGVKRILRKYLKTNPLEDGDVASCPNCGSKNLIRSEGCIKCADCQQWSKC